MSARAGLPSGHAPACQAPARRISLGRRDAQAAVSKLVRRRSALKYLQVRDYLRIVAEQELQPGDPVPSERDLCDRFGVSRMTVRQAVDALVVEGLLQRVQGSALFVARPKVDLQVRLTSFTEEMRRRGMTPSVRHLRAETVPADAAVAQALEISPGDDVVPAPTPVGRRGTHVRGAHVAPGGLVPGCSTRARRPASRNWSPAVCRRLGARTPSTPVTPTPRKPDCSGSHRPLRAAHCATRLQPGRCHRVLAFGLPLDRVTPCGCRWPAPTRRSFRATVPGNRQLVRSARERDDHGPRGRRTTCGTGPHTRRPPPPAR